MNAPDRYKAARVRFFNENPWAVARSEQIDVAVTEACGITVEDQREQQRMEIFAKAAESRGIDVDEFVIQLVATSPQQAHEWRIEDHKHRADVLGIDWEHFKRMNGITE
ncbi:DUF6388 family protein [Pseudomonas monteilii]